MPRKTFEELGLTKCGCSISTGICGFLTYGTGKLSDLGYWEFPCPHGNDMKVHEDELKDIPNA